MRATGSNTLLHRRLSIRVSTGGFSFYTLKGWQHHGVDKPENLGRRLDEAIRKLLRQKVEYDEVRLLADYPSTRVPIDEFRSEQEKSIYLLTFGEDALRGLSIQHEAIPALDVVELFPINLEARDVVLEHFPDADVHGFYAQMVRESFSDYRLSKSEQRRLYVSVEGKELFICAFAGASLAFANSYPDPKVNNRLYYTLYAWTQLGMDTKKDTLVLSGDDKQFEGLLRRYIGDVQCV